MPHRRAGQPEQMDWFAVRALILRALPDVAGLALAAGLGDDDAVARAEADTDDFPDGGADGVTSPGVSSVSGPDAPDEPPDEPNRLLLAGTSSRKEAKILPSSGWVQSTLAVSDGTTSERG